MSPAVRIQATPAALATIERLENLAETLLAALRDGEPAERIELAIRAGFADNFDREAAGDDYQWQQLAASTQAERRLLGYPPDHPILERSGDYRQSFTNPDHPAAFVETILTRYGLIIEAGSEEERAEWLEFGTPNIPAREVTVLGREAKDRLDRTIHELTLEILARSL